MKRSNVTSPQQEDDMMSHSSLSFVDDIACNDATSLKRELLFLKGAMKEKDEELTRLREEKFGLVEEMGRLKEKVEIQAKMLLQVSKEKEQATEQVKDVMVEMAKMLVQVQNEKEEAAKEIKACKEKLEESNQKISKGVKEKEAAIKSVKTGLSHQEALHKISNLEKEALSLSVWKSSRTKLVSHSGDSLFNDVLNCAPLKSGTFEWTIQVHSATTYNLYLGVIGSSLKLPLDDWIGETKKTWGYQTDDGDAYYWNDGQKVIYNVAKYNSGSIVHFVLDLTNDGTLCVSVDGSRSVQAFSNMKSLIDKDEGFLPATTMWHANKIELLEFKYH